MNNQTNSRQLTTPKDPQNTVFMESLVCKAARCSPHMALDASFSLEATLEFPMLLNLKLLWCTTKKGVLPGPWEWLAGCTLSHWETPHASSMDGGECSLRVLCAAAQHSQAWTALAPSAVRQAQTHCSSGRRLSPADATSCPCGLCPCHAGGVAGPSQDPQACQCLRGIKGKGQCLWSTCFSFCPALNWSGTWSRWWL